MRLAMVLGLIVAALTLSATDLRAERRVALVIGNGVYQNAVQLSNPINDAKAMADLFRKAGFDIVDERENLGSLEIKRAIREFTAQTRNADIAVVYFAGHGIEVSGTNYLVPVDAKLANDFDAEDEALALDRVVRALEPAKRLRLIILDACRDNPFLRTMQRTIATRAVVGGLAKVEPASSDTLIAFAAKAGSTAADGDGVHSPFTAALLKNLAVPGLDVRLAFGRVRDDVLQSTGSRQEPFVYGSLGGSTVALVQEPKRAAPPAASANDIRRDYELAERVGTAEAWDSFLAVYKSGFYADLARAARAKLAATSPGASAAGAAEPRTAIAALPAPDNAAAPSTPAPDPVTLTRSLQAELKRVGCDPGAEDGKWSAKSRQALGLFNKHAGARFDTRVASLAALEAVRAKETRVCPLVCGAGTRREGETCVAIPTPGKTKPQAARPPQPDRALRDRPPARDIRRSEERRTGAPRSSGAAACETPITVGGRQCCTHDTGGAPRIICQ
ncbi:MAG: caspase family protein [Pseudorhodoplanes sp.]|jgi:hypothetical protein|nr:caspase family protein [Pseudorhodoplanes sp.]